MKIAFYVYPTAFQNLGGGEVQLLKTKEYLEKLGVSIKLFDIWNDKLRDFDILHVFGSVKDALPMMEEAKRAGTKIVLSTICWYSWKSAWGTYPSFKARTVSLVRQFAKEFMPFLPSERKRMMRIADLLIPNSQMEASQLSRYFGIPGKKIQVVPNGTDARFAEATPDLFMAKYGIKDFVLCMGRIEPRKNQLSLVRALKGTRIPLVFIGDPVSQYQNYYDSCRREADPDAHFLGGFPHGSELLASACAACDIFALPTWLETPGLAALEAGLAGAKVVITREGATREYFGDFVDYVSPDSPGDIRKKILEARQRPKNNSLKRHIRSHYLWEQAATQTLAAYEQVMGRSHG